MKRDKTIEIRKMEDRVISTSFEHLRVAWTREIISSEGAHYHCWVPRNLPEHKERHLIEKFEKIAKNYGDPVKLSWDYIPDFIRQAKCQYCANREVSHTDLPYFQSKPEAEEDKYYCGYCYGWD